MPSYFLDCSAVQDGAILSGTTAPLLLASNSCFVCLFCTDCFSSLLFLSSQSENCTGRCMNLVVPVHKENSSRASQVTAASSRCSQEHVTVPNPLWWVWFHFCQRNPCRYCRYCSRVMSWDEDMGFSSALSWVEERLNEGYVLSLGP